jgi:hypothetical protein
MPFKAHPYAGSKAHTEIPILRFPVSGDKITHRRFIDLQVLFALKLFPDISISSNFSAASFLFAHRLTQLVKVVATILFFLQKAA